MPAGKALTSDWARRRNGPPFMLDMTLSVVAGGKVAVKLARGESLPDGWLVDQQRIEPHVTVFDKSIRSDGTFSREEFA